MAARALRPTPAQKRVFGEDLPDWFCLRQRDLPWRRNRTPYRVWLSELMLQQTRVNQVIPYYKRFLRVFPSIKALAEASQQEVLKQWEGLGYYARARNLHRTAQWLHTHNRGRFPRSREGLLGLPGIGPYTAAAVASLAFGEDCAVLDGNVIRVLSRCFALSGDVRSGTTRRLIQEWADTLLPPGRSANYNEGLMELGSTVCTPRSPGCGDCPLRRICRARRQGCPEAFPRKTPARVLPEVEVAAGVLRHRDGRILIAQRPEDRMLGGLWEFPGGKRNPGETLPDCLRRELKEELGITVRVGRERLLVRHSYSHFKLKMHVFEARIERGQPQTLDCADWAWVSRAEMDAYPFSTADLKIIEELG